MKNKWLLIVLLVVVSISIFVPTKPFKEKIDTKSCKIDSDCVPANCCHSTNVLNKANAPDCTKIDCTLECRSNTLDCGCGKPVCVNSKCEIAWTKNDSWC